MPSSRLQEQIVKKRKKKKTNKLGFVGLRVRDDSEQKTAEILYKLSNLYFSPTVGLVGATDA